MKGLVVLILVGGLVAPATAADRHEGVWRFAPAPQQQCVKQARQNMAKPVRPQRLKDQPAAYAIRLKNDADAKPTGCFQLQRER